METKPTVKVLSPWTIFLILVFAVIIFLPAVMEYFSAKRDLVQLWHNQGQLLSETILRSADRISMFDQQTEVMDRDRLQHFGAYLRTLDSLNYPRSRMVRQYARREGRFNALFFNRKLRPEFGKRDPRIKSLNKHIKDALQAQAQDPEIIFIPDLEIGTDNIKGIAIRRSDEHGFIVLLPPPRQDQRTERDQRHVTAWMDHLTRQSSLEYIVLFRNNQQIASSGPHPDEQQIIQSSPHPGRLRTLKDKEVFEYVQIGHSGLKVLIGLPTDALNRLQQSLVQRLILNSVILLVIGSILIIYLIKKQNYRYLRQRYAHIHTYNTSILESIEEGIIVLNQDRTVSVMNPAAALCLNIDLPEIEQNPISELGLPFSSALISRFNAFEIMNEIPIYLTNEGKETELLITTNVADLKGDDEPKQIYIILIRDNTAQKELQEFRSRRSKLTAMGELASRVAHEIRNPLNGIAVLAQRIQKEFSPTENEPEFERMARSIHGESNRINAIIEAFLNYARTPDMKLKQINFQTWFEDAAPLLSALGKVYFDALPVNSVPLQIDPDQMQQALINLVKNAVEASNKQVYLAFQHEIQKKELTILIEDNGSGISEEDKEHVFDLYFSTKENGSGLGLSIVEKIISAHNGKIRFESPYQKNDEWQGGTRFQIVIPTL